MTTVIDGTTGINNVQDGVIVTADLADLAITTAKLADASVTPPKTTQSITYSTPVTPLVGVNAVMSFTHGLGATPAEADLEVICLTAEFGYAVGDIVRPCTVGSTYAEPFSIARNATTVFARTSTSNPFSVIHNTSGVAQVLTAANWSYRFKVRAA